MAGTAGKVSGHCPNNPLYILRSVTQYRESKAPPPPIHLTISPPLHLPFTSPSPAPPLPFRPAIGSGLQRSFQFNLNMWCESNRAAETQSSPDVMKQWSKGLSVCPKHYISQKNVDDFENVGNCVQTANSVTMTSESIIRSTDTRRNVWREIAVLLQRPIWGSTSNGNFLWPPRPS